MLLRVTCRLTGVQQFWFLRPSDVRPARSDSPVKSRPAPPRGSAPPHFYQFEHFVSPQRNSGRF